MVGDHIRAFWRKRDAIQRRDILNDLVGEGTFEVMEFEEKK
jgi:hypothetical protein